MKVGDFAGDSSDPRNRIGRDGLTTHQRAYMRDFSQDMAARRTDDHKPPRRFTEKLITLPDGTRRWITYEEWDALAKARALTPRDSLIKSFKPEWYPALDKFVSSESELRAEMKRQGKEFRY